MVKSGVDMVYRVVHEERSQLTWTYPGPISNPAAILGISICPLEAKDITICGVSFSHFLFWMSGIRISGFSVSLFMLPQ